MAENSNIIIVLSLAVSACEYIRMSKYCKPDKYINLQCNGNILIYTIIKYENKI